TKPARMGLENPSSRSTALIRQMIKISRRERPTSTSRSFGRRKFPRAEVLLRAKLAARNPFVLSWQPERVERENRPYANRITKSRALEIDCLTIFRLQTCDRHR